jgi:hypothetical protein
MNLQKKRGIMKCEFCKKTGKYYSVNIENGGIIPEQFNGFRVILSFNIGL